MILILTMKMIKKNRAFSPVFSICSIRRVYIGHLP